MLRILREKKTAKKVWIVLALIIVPAFVLWGSGSLLRNKEEPGNVGKIFGRNVSYLEYKDALDAVRNLALIRLGDKFSEMQKYLNLESQAWDRLLLLYEAKKRKIRVSDKEVIEAIQNYPFFQHNGQFDERIYNEINQYVFHTQPRVFEEQTRQNLIVSKLYEEVTKGVLLSEEEIKQEYQKSNEQVSVFYMVSAPSEFVKDINPTDTELKDYFAKNQLNFKRPLSFNMDYITLATEDQARQVISRLNKKEDFYKIAKESGLTVKETGLFGQADPIPEIGWAPEITNLISKFSVGQSTMPIKTDKYYYILRLKERKEPYIPDFEKIKDKAKEVFIKDKSTEIAKGKIQDCQNKLKEGYADFAKCAKDCGLKYDSTNLFKFGSYIEGIGASDSFWMAAKKLKDSETSDIIEMPSGFFIIKLKSLVGIDEKKFESERSEFTQKLLLQKKQDYFDRFIYELKRRV